MPTATRHLYTAHLLDSHVWRPGAGRMCEMGEMWEMWEMGGWKKGKRELEPNQPGKRLRQGN